MKRTGRPRGSITARVPRRPVLGEDGKPLARVYDVTLRVPNGADAFGGTTYTTYRERGKLSRKAANDALARMIAELADGTRTPARRDAESAVTYIFDWIERKHRRGDILEGTANDYEGYVRASVVPAFGNKRLNDLTTHWLQSWVDDLAGRLKPNSVRRTWTVVDGALAEAVRMRLLGRNPGDGIRLPRLDRESIPETTVEEVQSILLPANEANADLFGLMALLGLRRSEALGLTTEHVDLDAGMIRIRKGLHRVKSRESGETRLVVSPPKTKSSQRDIPLGPLALAILRRARARQVETLLALGRTPQPETHLFLNAAGEPRSPEAVSKEFARLAKKAGVKATLRDLRNFAATQMIDNQVDPATAANVLGHSTPNLTLRIYVRTRKDAMRRAAEAVETAFVRKPAER